MLTRASIRRFAVMLIALLGFAHAGLALSACTMERGDLSQALAGQGMECCEESVSANGCVTHCTSDLQNFAASPAMVQPAVDILMFVLPARAVLQPDAASIDGRPPNVIPQRILLHSFLV